MLSRRLEPEARFQLLANPAETYLTLGHAVASDFALEPATIFVQHTAVPLPRLHVLVEDQRPVLKENFKAAIWSVEPLAYQSRFCIVLITEHWHVSREG